MFVYGFDDFTELELDALETLSRRCGAYVCVSLPFEPGREAFRATAAVHARLSEIATERIELAAVDSHYAAGSRAALHQVERGLFESDPPAPVEAGDAIAFHSAGGARAEVELAAARVLDLLRGGTAPGDVAVVFRDPTRYSSLVEQVFGAYGVPYSLDRALPLRPHRPRPGAARADPLRAPRPAAPTTSSPTCAPPGCSSSRRWPTGSRCACARTARTARPRRARSGRASTGRSPTSSAWPARPTRRRTWRSSRPCWRACSARPTSGGRRCWPGPSSTTRACSAPGSRRWPSCARCWTAGPPWTGSAWRTCSTA